jgi:hypothetical protein
VKQFSEFVELMRPPDERYFDQAGERKGRLTPLGGAPGAPWSGHRRSSASGGSQYRLLGRTESEGLRQSFYRIWIRNAANAALKIGHAPHTQACALSQRLLSEPRRGSIAA